jgi:hypothetical protein
MILETPTSIVDSLRNSGESHADDISSLMQPRPLRTTVIGSYPVPGWLELASENLKRFGPVDLAELQEDAVVVAVQDQLRAGLDVITDGEQTRLDFNLSFYGYLEGIDLEGAPPRRFGPPAHDQRGRHRISRSDWKHLGGWERSKNSSGLRNGSHRYFDTRSEHGHVRVLVGSKDV